MTSWGFLLISALVTWCSRGMLISLLIPFERSAFFSLTLLPRVNVSKAKRKVNQFNFLSVSHTVIIPNRLQFLKEFNP